MAKIGKTITVEDFERNSTETPEFGFNSLSSVERERARLAEAAAKSLFIKALLHRHAPARFPISKEIDSVEARHAQVVDDLHPARFERLRPMLEAVSTSDVELSKVLGSAPAFDLRKPISNAHLTQRLLIPGALKPKPSEKIKLQIPMVPKKAAPAPKFNRAVLNLRKLHCVDETNPEGGADDMVLGGVLIGPSGGIKPIKSFVAGEFDDGSVQDFGSLFVGSVSLAVTPGYPKNLYCIFLLVESDSDDQEVADGISQACKLLSVFAAAVGQGVAAAAFAAAGGLIDAFAGMFIDEDHFPPYGIERRLDSQNEFGSDGVDKNRHTGNIKGHGGTYRIGYRWELTA